MPTLLGSIGCIITLFSIFHLFHAIDRQSTKSIPSKVMAFDFKRLGFLELKKLHLLNENELEAIKIYGSKSEGIIADLNGDNKDEIIIAGITKISPEEVEKNFGLDIKGYIKVFTRAGSGDFNLAWHKLFGYPRDILDTIEIHRLDTTPIPKILVVFSNSSSTFYWTDNIIVYYSDGEFKYISRETSSGPLKIEDLDGNGVEEIIVHEVYNPDDPAPQRILWWDIYEWSGNNLKKASEKFPDFYEDKIASYYKRNIELALRKEFDSELDRKTYIKANEDLISRAKEITRR